LASYLPRKKNMNMDIPQKSETLNAENGQKKEIREEEAFQACLKKIKETLTDTEWDTFKQGIEKYRTTLVIESLEK
jgi:hypothetical protein